MKRTAANGRQIGSRNRVCVSLANEIMLTGLSAPQRPSCPLSLSPSGSLFARLVDTGHVHVGVQILLLLLSPPPAVLLAA